MHRYRVSADGPLAPAILESTRECITWLPWHVAQTGSEPCDAFYTYGHPAVTAEMLDRFPGLKVVSNYGVGVDHIDLAACQARQVPVGNTPGILDGATADQGFALLLACGRKLVEGDRYARSPEFTAYDPGYMLGQEIHHATLGIVGLGRIGWEIAKRARGFDMQIVYHNRQPRTDLPADWNARYAPFEALLQESDYVMLSLPLSSATRGLIGPRQLAMMKPTAHLINLARGPVVETQALYEALASGRIAGAGLDVTDPEPLPRDHPLLKLPNVVIAPHLGSATVQTRQKMAELSLANLLAGLRGEPLLHRV